MTPAQKRTSTEAGGAAYARAFEQWEPGRRGQILAAAFEVFSNKGYAAGSMREIAARVGVTEPALYRHFASKEALFLELIRVVGGRVRDEGCELIAELEPDALREKIVFAFDDRRRVAMRFYGPLFRTVITAASRNPSFLAEYRDSVIEPLQVQLTEKAAEFDARFDVPDADATREARVRALLALVVGYLLSSFVIGDAPEGAIADAALRVMGWPEAA